MARLIPRKQIEEQQNISGSLIIGEDLLVGGNVIITGSLQSDSNFFLGDNLTDRGEITGSVFLTGSFIVDGLFELGEQTLFSGTSSFSNESFDTERYAGILAKDFGANVPTLYVSSTDGDDSNDGRSIQYPLRTIKRAAQLANPGYDGRYGFDTGSIFNGYVIKVQAGTYLEDNPVILPSNTTVWGAGLRITKINARNPEQDLFWVNSGCYIAEVTMGGLRLWPDQINPERGFGVAFQPGAFITTSPYVQNCSQISNQENSFTELYEDIPPGGGGLHVNGDVVDPDSPLASMVLDAYTQISPNGVGCLVNGRGFIQLVSFFTNFSYYAIRVNNGGHATLNNSNISFGLFGMYASGSRFISGSTGGNIDARDKARASYSIIVDTLNKGLEDGLPDVTVLNTNAGIKVTDELQYFPSEDSTPEAAAEVLADFNLVSAIVENGTSNYPTVLARSSTKGYGFDSPYNILGAPQTTQSLSASDADIAQISSSFGTILGIFADGTGSYNFTSSATPGIKVTEFSTTAASQTAPDFITGSVSSSFGTVLNILQNGLSVTGNVKSNNSASVAVTLDENTPFTTGISSSLVVQNSVSASFSIVYNILANGTGSTILDIPQNHQREYSVRKSNDNTKYVFAITGSGEVENATLTLFRGETYKLFVSAGLGPDAEPFFIRGTQTSGFDKEDILNYNFGTINNGDSNGTITFNVPYNAPNTLYYISQDTPSFTGVFNIVNNSLTPKELIESTLTYPATIQSSSIASEDVDKINGYDLLNENLDFIKDETIEFVSSSWSNFSYDESVCRRDIGFIVNGVLKDLLYGGNEESIRSGLFYYQYPSEATTTQLGPTLTAIKYVSEMASILLQNKEFVEPNMDRDSAASAIFSNREFIQNEVIAYISSSWSEFQYNEASCSRDVGFILDAVTTDLRYEGNARAVEAGQYYYLYPSQATGNQLSQTSDGIRYAAGLAQNIILNRTFTEASASTQAAYTNLRNNKQLIQNETIEFVNVAYPTLEYNEAKCRRDVGYIVDAVATDLLYSANERSVIAGRFYYDYPSIATTTQRRETEGGIQYAKIISEFIVKNLILDTPRIVTNDERLIRVTSQTNVTSSVSGTDVESANISSSFAIIEGIIKRGSSAIPSLVAQNTDLNWSITNPLNVSTTNQITNSFVNPSEIQTIQNNWGIITSIIADGTAATPTFTSSVDSLIKVTDGVQTIGSSVSNSITESISSSFSYVASIVSGGLDELVEFVPNTYNNIKVTSTAFVSGNGGDNSISSSFSSSIQSIVDIITNGLSSLQPLTSSLENNIKVGNGEQYISSSASGSLEDISAISSSISLVTRIIERGESAVVAKTPYTTPLSSSSVLAAYEILRQNIDFIQEETIQYLSSSWSEFEYDEAKCRRDVGLIISGAAEDLVWNSNSASVVNGQFYYEFPSQATGSQLAQTLDGINYASRLAQKLIQNIEFQQLTGSALSASILISNNRDFIQDETIQYLSSSWSDFVYDDVKCRRDVGYILDAAITDLKYGGNERSRVAGEYYFLFPSDATGSQLIQTTDGINYASRLAQKIAVGETFTSADSEKVEASRLLKANADLIANEVVEYVSSSWSGVQYDETKCKRDVKYILDAVRTDLVYGGNERTSVAGDFYYRYPSAATVAGVPSSTQQLDPTITGINYANRLAGVIAKSLVLSNPSTSILTAAELIRENRSLIQDNTIEFVSDTYPKLRYDVARCRRDTGFIVDAVVTDLVYGGNERSITAGAFYYLFPSQATDSQETETINALNFARDLAKLIALGGKAVEDSFDNVSNIIQSGSAGIPTLVENTINGIKATTTKQYTQTTSANSTDKEIVSASFANVVTIINNGTGSVPTIVENTDRGVLRIAGTQITSSTTPDSSEQTKVGSSFDIILDVVENGLGSLPTLAINSAASIKVTSTPQYVSASSATATEATQISESISIVTDIITNGIGATPTIVTNDFGNIKVTETSQNTSLPIATSTEANALSESISLVSDIVYYGTTSISTITKNSVGNIKVTNSTIVSSTSATATESTQLSSSISSIVDIITNGASSAPTLVENTDGNIKVTNASQYISSSYSGSLEDVDFVSSSISIVTKIVELGSGSYESAGTYSSRLTTENAIAAYEILKNNISFIQDETIAYLSSSWTTASYDESRCRRDVGLIISGAAEDLIWNTDSASIVNGKFYLEYPSQAETSQLFQTLDGINYASRLAQKLIQNIEFVAPSSNKTNASTLLVNNKEFIQNETIAYMSSSWDEFSYSEALCRRDISHIIDAVRTDLVYGGNERSRQAGLFYYSIPSLATSTQLNQTTDAVNYASDLVQKIVVGESFTSAENNKVRASNIIRANKDFIADEVVAYVSSSWGGADYVEATCKRDVKYILDAARTDLVYGGNERSAIAGDYYFRYPSAATVAGAPSATAQLDPTYTGILWANRLVQKIVLNTTLVSPSSEKLVAAELLKQNLDFIKDEAIAYLSSSWSNFDYNQTTCKRDIGYIVDAIRTDIVYGGNERSVIAGQYYYKFPSSATVSGSVSPSSASQLYPTLDGIRFAGELGQKVVVNTTLSSPSTSKLTAYNLLLDNKRWIQNQTIASINANLSTISYNETTCKRDVGYIVDAVATDILYGGNQRTSDAGRFYYLYPSAATGSQLDQTLEGIGYAKSFANSIVNNELVYTQTTSSINSELSDITNIGNGFDIVMNIIENGIGSIPTLQSNTSLSIKITDSTQTLTTASIATALINNTTSSFDIVLDIVADGTGSARLVKNTNGLFKVTDTTQYTTEVAVSKSINDYVSSSFNTIINILENGTGSLPTLVDNTLYNRKVSATEQYISSSYSGSLEDVEFISASISIVTNIIANGTASAPIIESYTSPLSSQSTLAAYEILRENIDFIQNETIAYLSSSWSTASYDEDKCKRDISLIISGAAEDLIWNADSASIVNGVFYFESASQATGAQLNQTLDGLFYASKLAQKLVQNIEFTSVPSQIETAYDLLVNNKLFVQNEVIEYISSSWSTKEYNEVTCKRDVGYIMDAVATDLRYGGNERAYQAGLYYYLYPSAATGSQIRETVTGVTYAKNLSDRILRGGVLTKVPHNRKEARELIVTNKSFIQNEVIAYVSASWNGFEYVEETCKRDVGFILDAVATDLVYGGNERSIEAGEFYYRYPSTATTTQLGPTLSGIRHAKGLTKQILSGETLVTASQSAQNIYNLILNNKSLIQTETIGFVNSAWSFFDYNEAKCRRDVGYILDAVATDVLYGGNERVIEAGTYYYLYPSLATVDGDGDSAGQLGQTLDGVKYSKGLTQKIVSNTLLQSPTPSEKAGYELLIDNKPLIQNEVIAFLSSSWSGVDGFSYNEASCSRDVAYIVDNVATDLIYGGNERSSKAGEYYFLYPSAATVSGYANPAAQLDQTTTGVRYAAGVAQKVIGNELLVPASDSVVSMVELMRLNKQFIQNETIQYIDAFYPYLTYNREKCRRDVGYIVDAVSTDLLYGGNERGIVAGDYYFRFPSKATTREQVVETVAGVEYAKAVAKAVVQNTLLTAPQLGTNLDANIKVTDTPQLISAIDVSSEGVSEISSSFAVVTEIIAGGLDSIPNVVSNVEGLIKATNTIQISSSLSGSDVEVDLVTSSFKLIRDIIYGGSDSVPDALASNFDYGFRNEVPTLLHITNTQQILGTGSYELSEQTSSISSSFGSVIDIVTNGTGSIPTLVANTSSSLRVLSTQPVTSSNLASNWDLEKVGNSFGIILNIIENGTSVIPTLASNTSASIKVTEEPQIISGSGADRLQGRLISSSIGLVIDTLLNNGTSSIAYKAPTATPNTNPKITSAYNLLLDNKSFIQAETIAFMSSSWSGFEYTQSLCERDLGLIIDGAAYDLLYGGNSASFVNGRFYFDYPSEATSSQLDQTITALRYAGGIAEKIVRNTKLQHISASLETSASFEMLKANKEFIQSESIAYISSSWADFGYNETTCKRDIGYIIDAVATDLVYGGNERSIVAGDYYYRFPSNATTSELEPTLTGVRYAKGISMNIISGALFQTSSEDTQYAYDLLLDNKIYIQSESVAYVDAKYPTLSYNKSKCIRDVGYIVDAVATDLLYGGNERANKAGEFYYLYPSQATGVQLEETTDAVKYAALMAKAVIDSTLIAEPQPILNTSSSIKVTNTPQYVSSSISTEAGTYEIERISSSFALVSNIIENGLGVVPTLVSNISQSVKFTNTSQYTTGTNGNPSDVTAVSESISLVAQIVEEGIGSLPALIPYTTPSTDVNTLAAYDLLRQNISFIQDETIAYLSSSWTTSSYDESKCRRDVGLIVSGAAEDLIWNSNSASLMNGYYYYLFPSLAETSQLNQTLDGINYANRLAQKVIQNVVFTVGSDERRTAWELVKNNMDFIKDETIAYLSSSWSTFEYSESVCRRDVGHILDAAVTDMFYGGNERSVIAGDFYYRYPSQATGSQINQTLDGVRYAGRLAQKVAQNITFVTASSEVSASYNLLRDNINFIKNETIAFISSSWSTGSFEYNETTCKRDLGYIVDAVSTDLLYGGNERSVIAGDYYFKYPSSATTAQLEPTVTAIDYAGGLAGKLVQSEQFVDPTDEQIIGHLLLTENRTFIQDETMAYLTASWSTFDYDKVRCRRDVGYIVDAVATDFLYGGNQRATEAGRFYYLYPSLATVSGTTNGQLEETLDGIRYASGVAQKVVQNIEFVTASSEVSASFDLLRKNKPFIQAEAIAYVSSSWSGVYYNEASCSRDVGFLVDAAATDLLYGGQQRSVVAGDFYYRFPSRATNAGVPSEQNQLDPTISGVRYAGRVASKVVQNPTYLIPSASVVVANDLLINNKRFIQRETIAFLSSSWSTLEYNEASCSRDVGFIIDAVRTDLVYGGNERSIEAGSYYYRIPSVAIQPSYTDNGKVGQKIQTVDGINFAKGVAEKVVNKTQLVFPGTRTREAAARLIAAKDELKQRAIGYTNGAFPYLVYNEASCSRDTGLIVDAVVTDLVYGGNERAIAAASSYYNGVYGSAAAVINEQRTETLETNRYLRTRVEFIAQGAPLEDFGSLIVATGIDYSYNGSGVTFKALPPNQGGSGVPDPDFEITELGGGRIYFTSGNQDGDFRIGTGLSINQATGTLVGRTFSKSLFSLVTPFSLALEG